MSFALRGFMRKLRNQICKFTLLLGILSSSAFGKEINLYQEVVMPGGPYEGQILDTSKVRGLVLLIDSNNILPDDLDESYGYIANISHNGKRYVGRVLHDAPISVSFIYEKFIEMMGGHADLVYHLAEGKPLELIYEIRDTKDNSDYTLIKLPQAITLDHILLTAELVKAVGDTTDLKEGGLENKFGMAYRMTSVPERLIETVVGEGRKTTVYDIPFDAQATQQSFWDTLNAQNQIGMSENYDLIVNNCITSAIRGLANGLSPEQEAQVKKQLAISFKEIGLLSRENITEDKIKSMMNEYAKLLGANQASFKCTPIIEESFFTDWLTDAQKEKVSKDGCN